MVKSTFIYKFLEELCQLSRGKTTCGKNVQVPPSSLSSGRTSTQPQITRTPTDLRWIRPGVAKSQGNNPIRHVVSTRWCSPSYKLVYKSYKLYMHIYPASRKVKFYEVFCKRPSFTRSSGLLGFIELSPFSHQCWIWLEPHLKLLMHDWEAFNHLQIIAPNGPFQVAMNSH